MNDSLKKITVEAIKASLEETANQFAEFLNVTLDEKTKKALIQVLENFKTKILDP